jgi:periplasmic protein TonB
MQAIRFPLAALLGLIFTAIVFWFLWALINGGQRLGALPTAQRIEFTRLRHDTETQTKNEKPERPKPKEVPQVPEMAHTNFANPGATSVSANIDTRLSMGKMGVSGGSDRDVIPLVRINPEYPRRAQERGIEGWVQFEFTITPSGTVADVKVIDAEPKGMFEDAATKAIQRWKYNPKVVDGRPVERRGIRVVLRFNLEE